MRTFEKLKQRIDKEFELNTFEFRRVRAGYWQRAAGAWSWACRSEGRSHDIGSQYSASECINAETLSMCKDGTIMVENKSLTIQK